MFDSSNSNQSENNVLDLDFERITRCYHNSSSFVYLGIFISVCFLSFVVYIHASPITAYLWVTAVFVFNIPRIFLTLRFRKKFNNHEITPNNIKPWELYYFLFSILPFLSFSSVIFLPFKEDILTCVLYCIVINICMVIGHVITFCTSKSIMLLHINIFLLLPIIRLLYIEETLATILAIYLFIAYIMISKVANVQSKSFIENISLKIESKNQSLRDPLTQLWNRRGLYLYIEKLIPASQRRKDEFSLILLDIDFFKKFNDVHGHDAGDKLLIELSEILLVYSREQDLVVRYGGEEFLMVLPSTTLEQAKILIERIQTNISKNIGVTISAGLAISSVDKDFEQLVKEADNALYAAKESGRNKYIVADNI